MDFYDVLKQDHDKVEKLLERLEKSSKSATKGRDKLFQTLKAELIPHLKGEEEIFYPRLRSSDEEEARMLGIEGVEEQHIAERLLEEIEAESDAEVWAVKMKVLKELVLQHVEEEESEIFETAREVIPEEESEAMAGDWKKVKAKYKMGEAPRVQAPQRRATRRAA